LKGSTHGCKEVHVQAVMSRVLQSEYFIGFKPHDETKHELISSTASLQLVGPVEYIVGPSFLFPHPAQSPLFIVVYGPSSVEALAR